MTVGKSGTYLNTSISPLNLYSRQKVSTEKSIAQNDNSGFQSDFDLPNNIFSLETSEITSQDMVGIKEAIVLASQQRSELKNDLKKIKLSLLLSKIKLYISYILIYGLLKKSITNKIKLDINLQEDAIIQTKEQIEQCYVKLDIEFDKNIKEKYNKLVDSFKQLCKCHQIWDILGEIYQDRVAARSSASTIVKQEKVKFSLRSLENIKSEYHALYMQNINGGDIYIYPSFVVLYSNEKKFALISLEDVELIHSPIVYSETKIVPGDTKIIGYTWAKVNKNGSPDRRFKGNYQIPLVEYGGIKLKTKRGLNEEYQFSNYQYTEDFGKAFEGYQNTLKSFKK